MKKLYKLFKANAKLAQRDAFKVEASDDTATIYMYDVIDADFGINAIDFAKSLAMVGPKATINLRINSPGGDVFEARAIATAIKAHAGKVVAHIDGLAASAATTIAVVADEVVIAEGSLFMIHNSWTIALGDRNDMRDTADLLEKIDGAIALDYATRTGKSIQDVAAMMDAETWLTAAEAVDAGFADRLADEPKAKAKNATTWDVSAYDNAPAILNTPEADPAPDYTAQRTRNENRLRMLSIN